MKTILFLILVFSCTHQRPEIKEHHLPTGDQFYKYTDSSGDYLLQQKLLKQKGKIISSNKIKDRSKSGDEFLEKNITVSQVGNPKAKKLSKIRPIESQFIIWLEGEKKISQTQILLKEKKLRMWHEGSPQKWNGYQDFDFPSGAIFCYFSQIPQCLKESKILDLLKRSRKGISFFIIWESYPYNLDIFSSLNDEAFSKARVTYDGPSRTVERFSVEVSDQIISYHFSKTNKWLKMIWVSQGITISSQAELN